MKLGEITQLIGLTIVSYDDGTFICAGDRRFEIDIEDDGCGGNDSHAFISGSSVGALYGHVITAARTEDDSSDGVCFVLEAGDLRGWVQITHDHNGYYGFSYDIREVK